MIVLGYLVPRIAIVFVCAWGIVLGFKNWQVDRPAAKLVIIASIIRLTLIGWSSLQLVLLATGSLSARIMLGPFLAPLLLSLIESAVIALLVYAVFRGRPGANLWPLRSH